MCFCFMHVFVDIWHSRVGDFLVMKDKKKIISATAYGYLESNFDVKLASVVLFLLVRLWE